MSPTITDETKDAQKREKRPDSLICRVKYTNTLPDLAFEPKFLNYPFETNRFVQYNSTSLERNYKHELLTEQDAGVEIDLVDQEAFVVGPLAQLDPADAKLFEDDPPTTLDASRSRHHNKSVSWLRKTEYLSTELYNKVNRNDKLESRIGYNVKHMLNEDNLYRDRQSQIDAIEKTFSDATIPIEKHFSKSGVKPVEILPVLPDFVNWKYPCAQVIFDAEPVQNTKANPDALKDSSQAIIRGMMDDTGDEFVAFFLPSDDTKAKRASDVEEGKLFDEEAIYDYQLTREYKWKFKNKSMGNFEENYFFVFREDAVYYNEMETRVRLNKRRKFTAATQAANDASRARTNSTILRVQHRDFTDDELRQQAQRLSQLEPLEEEEEDEEDEGGDEEADGSKDENDDDDKVEDEDQEEEEDAPPPAKKSKKVLEESDAGSGGSSSDSSFLSD